jgi:hypothetical protein
MKTLVALCFMAVISFTACNNSSTADKNTSSDSTTSNSSSTANTQDNSSLSDIVTAYLQLKNALADDDSKAAASSSNSVSEAIKKIDVNSLSGDEKKVYQDVADDMKEHAGHIAGSSDKIAHQREHFEMMSKDLYDLVKAVKPGQTLYKDFCPMYNNNKGGMWLSETKDIKNPYLGKKMPECGEVQEEIAKK